MKKLRHTILAALILFAAMGSLWAKDYTVDLAKITAWDESVTKINAKSSAITFMKAGAGVSIDLGNLDCSDYNSLELTWKDTAVNFSVVIDYTNGEKTDAYVEEHITYFSIPLNQKAKSGISKISFVDGSIAGSLKFFTITFKEEAGKSVIVSQKTPVLDEGPAVKFNKDLNAIDFTAKIKVGINIGNTFDANGGFGNQMGLKSETYWGNPKITREQIVMYKDAGYDLIRIPVTWYNHIIDDKYTIDPLWMGRVKTVVNWAIDEGLYVILNEHHSVRDGMGKPVRHCEGYMCASDSEEESEAFLQAVWTQIAAAFNDSYDEHLIFETMNEPRNTNHGHTWNPNTASGNCAECQKDFELCNKYNQICLDAIRKSGGNNANRFVMIPGLCTGSGEILNSRFEMPADSAKNKLIATFHDYTMGAGPEWARPVFSRAMEIQLEDLFIKMENKFVANGIPVIMGETGAVKKIAEAERVKWIGFTVPAARKHGIVSVLWEDGGNFKSFDRANAVCIDQAFVDEMTK